MPATIVAHSAEPRTTKVMTVSSLCPVPPAPMIWIMTTSSSSDAIGLATV